MYFSKLSIERSVLLLLVTSSKSIIINYLLFHFFGLFLAFKLV
uniref:Uncharacterized protein n=1 Tax=Heterorhabditis bacteriophora TaxID=37862 RepID=A0A1I7WM78_HETBA